MAIPNIFLHPQMTREKNPVGKMSIQINNCICFEYGSNTYCCVLRQMQYATSIGSLLVDSAPGAGDLTLHTHTLHTHAHTLQHYICYFVYFKFLIQNRVAISLPGRSTLFTLLLCFFFLYFSLHFLFCCCALFTIIVSQWSYLYIDEAHSDFWINIWLYSGKAQQKKNVNELDGKAGRNHVDRPSGWRK